MMPWNSETQQFEAPPLLEEIWEEPDLIKQVYQLADFVDFKRLHRCLPLSEAESAFADAYGMYGEIMGDGWDGLFDCHSPESWNRIFALLTELGYSALENTLRRALHLRNPRPIPPEDWDDPTVAQLENAQVTPQERSEFCDLEPEAKPELLRLFYDLPSFVRNHRNDFLDFPQ